MAAAALYNTVSNKTTPAFMGKALGRDLAFNLLVRPTSRKKRCFVLQVKKGGGTSWEEEKRTGGEERPFGIPTRRLERRLMS